MGLNEEQARTEFGEDGVEVYLSVKTPLEMSLTDLVDPETGEIGHEMAHYKLIVERSSDPEKQKVLGIHFVGPNAGEIMQGLGVAMSTGLTKGQLDRVFGIHPTVAEEFVVLETTKSSGESPVKSSCLG